MIKSPFDFSVQFQSQVVRLGKRSKLFRSISSVVFLLPCLVPRLPAVFGVLRRSLLADFCGLYRIVSADKIGVASGFQGWTGGPIIQVVQPLFFPFLRFGFVLASIESKALPSAKQLHTDGARAVDMACRPVCNLSAMCAVIFHR